MQLREKLSPNKMGFPKKQILETLIYNPTEIQNQLLKEEKPTHIAVAFDVCSCPL